MAALLEFLFQFVLEMLFNLFDAITHWRLTLAVVLGDGAAFALECLGPDHPVTDVLVVLLAVAGVSLGIIWETRSRR